MRWPDFFIVGAPKCGTTALYTYLRDHPQVFVSRRKEPHFFAVDLDTGAPMDQWYFVRDEAAYLELFAGAGPDLRLGEASPFYLYSVAAAAGIRRRRADARIIVMLRNPIDMMHALHAQKVRSGGEDIRDFLDAIAAETDRRAGRRLPERAFNVKSLLYRDVARYGLQLERYIQQFGRDRVHVILYEEFSADVARAYAAACAFLGVDENHRPALERVNANAVMRSPWLRNLLRNPPAPLRLAQRLGVRTGMGAWLRRRNLRRVPRARLDAAVRRQLWTELAPDVRHTSELVGRDLTAVWQAAE